MLWAPYTKSNGQWIANKALQGFLGAPIESLCEISVSDVVRYGCLPFRVDLAADRLVSTSPTSVVPLLVSTLFSWLAVTSSRRSSLGL